MLPSLFLIIKLFQRIQSVLFLGVCLTFAACLKSPEVNDFYCINFNKEWDFVISDETVAGQIPEDSWAKVDLPHTPVIEPLIVNDQWQGVCWYRKQFILSLDHEGKLIFLKFEGAMNVAEVWINGTKKTKHLGGYLPFVVNVTEEAVFGDHNEVIVRLDNTDNPITGPKPLKLLDFNTYGGLYRDVFLMVKNRLFITDPIYENMPASGGIFVTYPEVSEDYARISIQTHVRNEYPEDQSFQIRHQLFDDGIIVVETQTSPANIGSRQDIESISELELKSPELWSPAEPNLYVLVTHLMNENQIVDTDTTRIGIRRFEITRERFAINGKVMFLRGVNRHQEYPYIGYALSNEAQYRDARKIKDAGFDYVRLSHYPHSPAFMDACDELGLVVLDAIPGWQYFSENEAFQNQAVQTCRDMIRRDRNHPCVMAWEVSLNESWMTEEFIDQAIAAAREEHPGDQCFTAGWQKYGYDIYLQARQHRIEHYTEPEKPYIVSEYGDWEYYALNAGLNQEAWQNLLPEERTSRQLLSSGEKRLLQQTTNIQEAQNDNFNTPAFADGYWVMFDYNRGYADDLEASGIMSINRLPKFSYYFFQSQRDADEISAMNKSGPMVFIASYWDQNSDLNVRVFSNCEEVGLYLNDSLIARQMPDSDRISNNLAHPPFTFKLDRFIPGKLTAIGFIDDNQVTRHEVNTPAEPVAIKLELDECGRLPKAGGNDICFIYASLIDSNGTVVPVNGEVIEFIVDGNASIVNTETVVTEAGIATLLVKIGDSKGSIKIEAENNKLKTDEILVKSH